MISMVKPHTIFLNLGTFIIIVCATPPIAHAQRTELRASLNSGFYSYRGSGAEAVSFLNNLSYTNNPYGSKGGLSYGLSLDMKRISKKKFIWGANLGYEVLRSKVNLKYTDAIGDIRSDFEGRTYLNTSLINLFPYLGGRVLVARRSFDLTGGCDIGYIVSSTENGHAKSTDNAQFDIRTSVDRRTLRTDIRPRIQLSTDFDQLGIYAGYAIGLRNYKEGYIGSNDRVYSQLWRFGITYRLN